MSDVDLRQGKLAVGRVFGEAFGVLRRQIVPMGGFLIALSLLSVLNLWFNVGSITAVQTELPPGYWVMLLIGVPLGAFSYAFLFHLAVSDLAGDQPSWRRSLRAAVGKILPVLGLMILWGLGVGLGWILLFVPGLILMTMWAVCLPALASEAIGPIRAFGRSRALTKGNRWRVFGVLVLLLLVLLLVDVVVLSVTRPLLGAGAGAGPDIGGLVAATVLSAFYGLLVVALLSALYVQLRSLKEGLGGASAAAVFD